MGHQRNKLFVDGTVQGALLKRTVLYWFYCLLTVTMMLFCWRFLSGPPRLFHEHFEDLWFHYGPALAASLLVLPLVLLDLLRLSNRFVGPIFRMRRVMKKTAATGEVQPVHFRDEDFWQDFADDFNILMKRHQELLALDRRGGAEQLLEAQEA